MAKNDVITAAIYKILSANFSKQANTQSLETSALRQTAMKPHVCF
jgi:hypothetical protein